MELEDFMGENRGLLRQVPSDFGRIRYCVKLSSVANRREETGVTNKFASMVSGIGNLVSDTLSSAVFRSYLVGTEHGAVGIISEKLLPVFFDAKAVSVQLTIAAGVIQFHFVFSAGSLQNAVLQLSVGTFETVFWGDLTALFGDFDTQSRFNVSNLSQTYASVRISKPSQNPDKPFEMTSFCMEDTFISYDNRFLYLNNLMKKIPFDSVLLCHCSSARYCFVTEEEDTLVFYEICSSCDKDRQALDLNLLAENQAQPQTSLVIAFPKSIPRPKAFLSICQWKTCRLIFADQELFLSYGDGLVNGGIFTQDTALYVKRADGAVQQYEEMEPMIRMLSLLPTRYDSIFMIADERQPCLIQGQIRPLLLQETGVEIDGIFYSFVKMQDFQYAAKDYSCSLTFTYAGDVVSLLTAGSLGISVSNRRERVVVGDKIKDYTINQLYDCNYKNQMKNFIAGTLAEIFKTDKLLNLDVTVDEQLDAMEAADSAVLRNALQSVAGKFKDMDDLQAKLIQKLTLLEIQRRKVQKLLDEWILFYPHYAASSRVRWLKEIFSPLIKEEVYKTEYWRCVSHFKRLFGGLSVYIQKMLNEIALCTNRLMVVMPEEAKRADIPAMLRVSPRSRTSAAKTGADITLAVATGAELANFLVRGFSVANPLVLSMSVKMLVDSYVKDVAQRKDIKAFGTQALEWWQILMKGLAVHVLELSKGFNDDCRLRIRQDTALFLQISPAHAQKVKSILADRLQREIIHGINEKYLEIMPQLNVRIADILNDVKAATDFCDGTMEEFEENIYK